MKTLKLLTVLGLMLAISMPASALTWNAAGTGYTGPINIDFDFVSASGYNQAGQPINWGIFRARTITAGSGGPVIWTTGDGGIELSGILYKLRDQAIDVYSTGATLSMANIWGNDLHIDLYENTPTIGASLGAYDTAVAAGTGSWGGASNVVLTGGTGDESFFPGLTDANVNGPALRGDGAIAGSPATKVLIVGSAAVDMTGSGLITHAEQKTNVTLKDINNTPATREIVEGFSTAYLDWYSGYLLEPAPVAIIPFQQYDSTGFPPVAGGPGDGELIVGAMAMAQATQSFLTTDTTYNSSTATAIRDGLATDGWEFASHGTGGHLDAVAIPEPLTMIALFGGIAGLGGYIRKRRMA